MKEINDKALNDAVFTEPELKVTLFSDDQILADSNRCCDDHANYVGYT